jgi:hypothetical protein
MKKYFLFALAVTSITIFTGCKKNGTGGNSGGGNNNPPAAIVKDVYVAGYEINGSGKNVAMYWKNGTVVKLTDGSRDAVANSIFVDGNDVYAAGYQDKAGTILNIATYWKNGVAYSLSITGTGGNFDAAKSIFISGTDVYAAGIEKNTSGNAVAKYWKNGTPVNLTDGTRNGDAQCVFVAGNDIYVAGSEDKSVTSGTDIAKYWKNGVAVPLTDGSTPASAMAILVIGTDVYVAGTVNDISGYAKPVYWKNGNQISLSSGSQNAYGFCMAISGSDIYVGGKNGNSAVQSGYWKNDFTGFSGLAPAATYPGGEEAIGGIAIVGTDVYAAGSYHNGSNRQAVLWKKGTVQNLGNVGLSSSAGGIFLTYQ